MKFECKGCMYKDNKIDKEKYCSICQRNPSYKDYYRKDYYRSNKRG